MSSGGDSDEESKQSQSSSVRAAEALIPVWIELERLLPNFASRHVRKFCRSLVQSAVEDPSIVNKHDDRIEGPVCIHRKIKNTPSINSANNADDLCKSGRCFCDLLIPSKTLEFISVLIVDVSDFSSRMSILKESIGPNGLEPFSKGIKRYFDGIIQKVLAYGGDIVKFAGDSVIMCWRAEPDHLVIGERPARDEAVFRSFQCAHSLLQRYGEYILEGYGNINDATLRIHACLGAAEVYDVNVGVVHSRWEHFLAGNLISDLGKALDLAKGGELSILEDTYNILNNIAKIGCSSVTRFPGVIVVRSDMVVERTKPALPLSINSIVGMWESIDEREGYELYKKFISDSAIYKLETDVLQSKLFFDYPTLSDLLGFYELREAVTLFIKLPSLSDWSSDLTLSKAQKAMEIAVKSVSLFGGVLRQFNYDDKGASMLIFFGIPPSSSAKCAFNAVATAIEIRSIFTEASLPFSMGLAFGTIFVSGVGNSVRTEYCALGYSINLGARLMCLKLSYGTILCDEKTALSCGYHFTIKEVDVINSIKGFPNSLRIFEIIGTHPVPQANLGLKSISKVDCKKSVIGLSSQRKIIKETLDGTSRPCCTAIFGEYDQGLTTLFEYSISKANSRGTSSVNIICRDRDRFNQLSSIREILRRVIFILDRQYRPQEKYLDKNHQICKNHVTNSFSSAVRTARNFLSSKAGDIFEHKNDDSSMKFNGIFPRENSSPAIESPIMELFNCGDTLLHKSDHDLLGDFQSKYSNLFRRNDIQRDKWRMLIQDTGILDDVVAARVYSEALFVFEASVRYNIAIIVHELQFMDTESWNLLWYSVQTFPKLRMLLFARSNSIADDRLLPSNHYNDTSEPQYLRKLYIERLTRNEICMLVAHFWPFSSDVKGITDESLDALFASSSGSPSCVASIILWIQSSRRWKILPGGVIEFDFGIFGGGSDDYNAIIISQFDQLGPRFRLILKVASVASPDISFNDIYRILMRVRWVGIFGLKLKHANRNKIILKKLDVHNFLVLKIYNGKLYLRFSSTKVQNLIYSMNVVSQRALLHKLIADRCSRRFLVEKSISSLSSAIHHYEKSGSSSIEILIKYIEVLARLRSGSGTISNKIELYKRLLSMSGSKPDVTVRVLSSVWKWRVIKAHWCIKIAKLNALCGNYDEFTRYISHSFCLLGCTATRNRDGICTYCEVKIGQTVVSSFFPLTNLASMVRQRLRHRKSIQNVFINPPQETRGITLSFPQYHNAVNSVLNTSHILSIQAPSTKSPAFDLTGIGRDIVRYIISANKTYGILDQNRLERLSKVPSKDIKYVEDITRRVVEEDNTLIDNLIATNLSKYCVVNSIVVNKEPLIPLLQCILDSLKVCNFHPRHRAKIGAVAALTLSTCTKDLGLIAKYVDEAIKNDDMQKPSATAYIIINLIHTLFYLGLWTQCDVATASYFNEKINTYIGYTEQTVFYGVLTFIRMFLACPITKLRLSLSHLFTLSIKISSGFAGFYTNAMLKLYSLVVDEEQMILPLPSRPPIENKEIIFEAAVSLYSDMRYNDNVDPSLSADFTTKIIKKKGVLLSPVTALSVTLMLVCYIAFLLQNPLYYKQKESKAIFKFAKLIARMHYDKNLPENLHIMNKPLSALCSAVINIFRKGPTGAIGPLKDALADRSIIRDNIYIRAVFSSFLLQLGDENHKDDYPKTLFLYLNMTYHVNHGVFGIGVNNVRNDHCIVDQSKPPSDKHSSRCHDTNG